MKSNSHSTAERRLRSYLHWVQHRCTGCSEVLLGSCCASPTTPTKSWCSLLPTWNTKGKYRKSRETLEGQLHWKRCSGAVCKERKQDSHFMQLQRKARGVCSVTWGKCSVPGRNVICSNALKEGGGAIFYFQPPLVSCVGNTAGTEILFCRGFAWCCR